MTLILSLCSYVIGSAHDLPQSNIWVKFNENRPKGSGDMERTRNSRVNPLALTLSLGNCVMCFSEVVERTRNSRVNPLTLTCDLDI